MRLRATVAILMLAVLAACGDGGAGAPTPAEIVERARNARYSPEAVAQSLVAISELHVEEGRYAVLPRDADAPTVCDMEDRQWLSGRLKSRLETTIRCDGGGLRPRILNHYVAVGDGKTFIQHWPEEGEYCVYQSAQGSNWAIRSPLRPVKVEGSVAFWLDEEPAYALKVKQGGKVAGRYTWVVEAKPLKKLEISAQLRGFEGISRFWVDAETFLLLKSELYLDDGSLLWRQTVTEIAYNVPVDDSLFSLQLPQGTRRIC